MHSQLAVLSRSFAYAAPTGREDSRLLAPTGSQMHSVPRPSILESLLAKVSGIADLDVAAPPQLVGNHVLMLDDRNRTGLAGTH